MKKLIAVLALVGVCAAALGGMLRVQVEKDGEIEAGYVAKVASIIPASATGDVSCVRSSWRMAAEVHTYSELDTTNTTTVTNWVRVKGAQTTNTLAIGDYVLPEDVFSTASTNVADVILEY